MKGSIIPIFIPHLGCPHACVFCNQRRIASDTVPTFRQVTEKIENALSYCEKPQICFYGGSFTAVEASLQEGFLATAKPFVDDGRADSIRLSTRPDAIDEKVIARLQKYGVKTVELGVQSMDDEILQKAGRGHTAADTVNAVKMLKNAGFEVILQIMPGLPGADEQSDMQTACKAAELEPAAVRIYPVCVIRDTELCDMYERGEYEPLSVENAAELCAKIWEIFEGKGIAVVRCGLNPTDELSNGSVVAGAYHPSFGQLARSAMMLNRVLPMLQNAKKAVISVQKGRLSDMRGQKNANVEKIKNACPGLDFEIVEDEKQTELVKTVIF